MCIIRLDIKFPGVAITAHRNDPMAHSHIDLRRLDDGFEIAKDLLGGGMQVDVERPREIGDPVVLGHVL